MIKLFSLVVTAALFFACSSDRPSPTVTKGKPGPGSDISGTAQQPRAAVDHQYALEITPKVATRKSTLTLNATGFDLSRAQIEWLMDGRPFTTRVPTQFEGADAAKGTTIQARIMVQDREEASNTVKIINSPPEISGITLMPDVFKPGDTFSVAVKGEDIDGDAVTFLYEWTRNGDPAGKESGIGTPLKRGDSVSVLITPFDGTDYGPPVLVPREIRNMPPDIVEHKDFSFDGTVYTYQVKASDPDGDDLAYSLETPLNGATIHPATGLFQWAVPPDFKGEKNVTLVVNDGHGGTAKYSVKITIQQQAR